MPETASSAIYSHLFPSVALASDRNSANVPPNILSTAVQMHSKKVCFAHLVSSGLPSQVIFRRWAKPSSPGFHRASHSPPPFLQPPNSPTQAPPPPHRTPRSPTTPPPHPPPSPPDGGPQVAHGPRHRRLLVELHKEQLQRRAPRGRLGSRVGERVEEGDLKKQNVLCLSFLCCHVCLFFGGKGVKKVFLGGSSTMVFVVCHIALQFFEGGEL